MSLRVIQYDEAVLRQPGLPVEIFDDDLRMLAENMLKTIVTFNLIQIKRF